MNFQTRLVFVGLTLSVAGFSCASFGAPKESNPASSPASGAATVSAPASKAAPAALKIDPRCVEILQKLTNTYKSASTIETKVVVDMQLQSSDGAKQKLPAQYNVSIAKPNRFSVELVSTRGGKVVSNGKRSEFFFKPANKYMIDKPLPTMQENFEKHEFRFVTAGLLNFSFLRELMEINPFATIMKDVRQVKYIGVEKIDGIDCDRLQITQGEFVRDIWVTRSKAPMLLQVEPNMTAGLSEKAKKAGNKIFMSLLYKDQILGKSMNDGRFEVGASSRREICAGVFPRRRWAAHWEKGSRCDSADG